MKTGANWLLKVYLLFIWAAEKCWTHNRFWSQNQSIWHYMTGTKSAVEFPMAEEYLVDGLKSFYFMRNYTEWTEVFRIPTKTYGGVDTVNSKSENDTKVHYPAIEFSLRDPIQDTPTSIVELSDKLTGVTSANEDKQELSGNSQT
jgi:hypothetical protein